MDNVNGLPDHGMAESASTGLVAQRQLQCVHLGQGLLEPIRPSYNFR